MLRTAKSDKVLKRAVQMAIQDESIIDSLYLGVLFRDADCLRAASPRLIDQLFDSSMQRRRIIACALGKYTVSDEWIPVFWEKQKHLTELRTDDVCRLQPGDQYYEAGWLYALLKTRDPHQSLRRIG